MDTQQGSPSKDQIESTLNALVLERIHYYATRAIEPQRLNTFDRTRVELPLTAEVLVARLMSFVYAERAQTEEVTVLVEVPATWWDHAKAGVRTWANRAMRERKRWWLPLWAYSVLCRLRVHARDIEQKVKFEHFVKYPDYLPPVDLELRRELNLGRAISEVRVNGSWYKRPIRVTGWWNAG